MAEEPTHLRSWNVLATVLSAVMGRVMASPECEDKQISQSAKPVPSSSDPPLLWKDPCGHPPALKTTPNYDCSAPGLFLQSHIIVISGSWRQGMTSTMPTSRRRQYADKLVENTGEQTEKQGRKQS